MGKVIYSDCFRIRPKLDDYAVGALDAEETKEVYSHILECERCRLESEQLASEWRGIKKLMDFGLPDLTDLRERIMSDYKKRFPDS